MMNASLSLCPEPETPCASPSHNAPCGEDPCREPCETQGVAGSGGFWRRAFEASLWNTLDVCFDDIRSEPQKILILGGCRQLDLSRRLALLLPAADITLVDPDARIAQKAREEVCCRFKFIAAPMERLPFETAAFDLTIAHNFLAYPGSNWRQALSEAARVTRRHLLLSMHRPRLWRLLRLFPGADQGMQAMGVTIPERLPETFEFLTHLYVYARIQTRLAPFPWTVYMTRISEERREEKLTLP